MGADTFMIKSTGKTAREAFDLAVREARNESGRGGYSGTIAEKAAYGFTMIAVPAGVEPRPYADRMLNVDDRRIADKYGPAGCIALGDDAWLFFGWAAS